MRKSRPVFQTKRYLVDLVSPSEREIKGSSFSFVLFISYKFWDVI